MGIKRKHPSLKSVFHMRHMRILEHVSLDADSAKVRQGRALHAERKFGYNHYNKNQ